MTTKEIIDKLLEVPFEDVAKELSSRNSVRDPLIEVLDKLLQTQNGFYENQASKLLEKLRESTTDLPVNARMLTIRIHAVKNELLAAGIVYSHRHSNGVKLIALRKINRT